jgi:two-component system, cell cycle response regulator DivK
MSKVTLIVEDDPRNMTLFRDLLQRFGVATCEATNGKEAVETAQKLHPALILMDIQLPVMSGIDATKILKADEATKHIPIIALTSFAMKEDEIKIRASGCDDYLSKPVDLRLLLKKVKDYTEKEGEIQK